MPNTLKPPEQRRRRNKPEQWTILPSEGCSLAPPGWPLERKPTKAEASYWAKVWELPIAWWWHEQKISPFVIARYVRTYCQDVIDPNRKLGPAVSRMERDLGLHPEALVKLRLVVAEDEEAVPQGSSSVKSRHYRHLKIVDGA
jgi:hypothetical protein